VAVRPPLLNLSTLAYLYRGSEAIPAAVHSLNKTIATSTPTIAYGFTRGANAIGKRPITDELVSPDLFEEGLFRDYMIVVLNEVGQQIEHLRFNLDGLPPIAELIAIGVELIITKDVDHPHLLPPKSLPKSSVGVFNSLQAGARR
jgi:hypothetical protein